MPINATQLVAAGHEHHKLYASFKWQDDKKTFKQTEYWDRPIFKDGEYIGDCDDWAFEMDFRLNALGIPKQDRRFAVCSMGHENIDHCALILMTDNGLYVSECNSVSIVKLVDLPYTMWYWSDESGDITKDWLKVE